MKDGSTEFILTKFKIKDGMVERLGVLLQEINSDLEAFRLGLQEAGVRIDCQFIETSDLGNYFYVFKKVASNDRLKEVVASSPSPIYQKVRRVLNECLENRIDLECSMGVEL